MVVITHGFVIQALLWLQSHVPAQIGQAEMANFNMFRRKIVVPNCSYVRAIPHGDGLWVSATPAVSHLPVELRSV